MADGEFNIAKGRIIELHNRVASDDPVNSTLVLVLLQVNEVDGTIEDYDTLNDLLAGANTEANFQNYARIELDQTDLSVAVPDDTNNWTQVDFADQTWSSAGGTPNNSLTKLLICYDPDGSGTGNDTTVVPMAHYDFTPTTNGNDLVLQLNANGYFRAP